MTDETKICPFCGGEIKAIAIKCKHCGKFLNDSVVVEAEVVGKIDPNEAIQDSCPKCGGEMEYKNSVFSKIFKVSIYIICGLLSLFFLFGIFYEMSDSEIQQMHQKREQEAMQKEQLKLDKKAQREQEKIAKEAEKNEAIYAKQAVKEAKKYEKQQEKEIKQQIANQPKLVLIEHHTCYDSIFGSAVCGTIKNNTNKKLYMVSVEIDLLDRNGSIVSRTSDLISRLDPYQSWAFKANVTEDNVASYRITEFSDIWGQ